MKPSSEEEENENNYQETENVLQKIQEQLKLSEDALNTASYRRSMSLVPSPNINLNQNIVKIKDSSLEFVNIEDDFKNKPKNCPFDDVCSICSSNIYMEKYLCLICKECILCKNCELEQSISILSSPDSSLRNFLNLTIFSY